MAKPRVFVSSTFYDLHWVRSDIEAFVRELGYEPVMFERGSVPYVPDKRREEQCYGEIAKSDILVAIIGDKLGTESEVSPGSISQNELRHALQQKKQTHVFVLQDVVHAYRFWDANKSTPGVKYMCDVRILEFLSEVYALTATGVESFRTVNDITSHLREQWSGLFQELLSQRLQVEQQAAVNRINEIAEELKVSIDALKNDRWAAQCIGHPLIPHLRKLLKFDYHVYVRHRSELESWLTGIGYLEMPPEDGFSHWHKGNLLLKIKMSGIFTDKGKGALMFPRDWDESNVVLETVPDASSDYEYGGKDDEIPF